MTTRKEVRQMGEVLLGRKPDHTLPIRSDGRRIGMQFDWYDHRGYVQDWLEERGCRLDKLSVMAFSDWLEERALELTSQEFAGVNVNLNTWSYTAYTVRVMGVKS